MLKTVAVPEWQNGLTNHRPMVISAFRELGATKAHIQCYLEKTSQTIEAPLTPAETVELEDVPRWLGLRQNFDGLTHFFAQQLQEEGLRATVQRFVPMLSEGLTAAAFHAVIRLGHAINDDDMTEVAASLAYWVWAYQPLPFPKSDASSESDLLKIVQHLLDGIDWPAERIGGGLITDEFQTLAEHSEFNRLCFDVDARHLSIEKLNQVALHAYWMHQDFTLLHGVTAKHAITRIAPLLASDSCLLKPMWRGLIYAWLSKGVRWAPVALPEQEPTLSIVEIKALAAHAFNDHTVKLVATCLDRYRKTEDKFYWSVAEREVKTDSQLAKMIE